MLIPNRSERITAPRILRKNLTEMIRLLIAPGPGWRFGIENRAHIGRHQAHFRAVTADPKSVLEKMRKKWYKKGLSAYALWVNNL
jgi:hypothetical protein